MKKKPFYLLKQLTARRKELKFNNALKNRKNEKNVSFKIKIFKTLYLTIKFNTLQLTIIFDQ